jgi:hypothetical protein
VTFQSDLVNSKRVRVSGLDPRALGIDWHCQAFEDIIDFWVQGFCTVH